MKASFKFILAALAATAALAGCTKEITPPSFENDKVNPAFEGSRVIAVSFAAQPQTRTYLDDDGLQPKFNDKDSILISNGAALDTCEVSVDGDKATISTNLTGPLTAVYPAKAAMMNGSNPNQIDSVLVSTVQSGTFADANICMAENITDKAVFENKTALFEITPPAGAKSFTITSLKPVEDGVARTGTAKAINTDGATDETRRVITVSNDTLTTFYVSLVPGVNLSDLSFDAGGTYGMKGIPTSRISTDQTAANTKYTINDENWHSYVGIEMTVGSDTKTYKWATENVGATTSNPNGDYFMWGYTIGHTATTTGADAFKDQTFQEGERGNDSNGFAWDNYIKFTSSAYSTSSTKVFAKYVTSGKASEYGKDGTFYDDKTTLDLADDAANANWGGSWRMPTQEEFDALLNADGSDWDGTRNGYNFGASPGQIFLPAAGWGKGTELKDVGVSGCYWASSLITDGPNSACFLSASLWLGAGTLDGRRYRGQSVRALSE